MAKDILGREIQLGDRVAFNMYLEKSTYSSIYRGCVNEGTVQNITVFRGGLEEIFLGDLKYENGLEEADGIDGMYIEANVLVIINRQKEEDKFQELSEKYKDNSDFDEKLL